jgi:hypothetical protein
VIWISTKLTTSASRRYSGARSPGPKRVRNTTRSYGIPSRSWGMKWAWLLASAAGKGKRIMTETFAEKRMIGAEEHAVAAIGAEGDSPCSSPTQSGERVEV